MPIHSGDSFGEAVAALRPPAGRATEYRARGWWREETLRDDLDRAVARYPRRAAAIAYRVADGRPSTLNYAQFGRFVERFAGALRGLDVEPGTPVAYQLPNWWEAAALAVACMRLGAVAVPIMPTIRAREFERILSVTQARVCVVADSVEDLPSARLLADLAPDLPHLRHRVVAGDASATGAVDFTGHFLRTRHEATGDPAAARPEVDPDSVCLVLFTSGTTGEPKAVLHTHNTLYAGTGAAASPADRGWDGGEVFCSPHAITYLAGLLYCVFGPVLAAGTGVYLDTWDPDVVLDVLSDSGVTQMFAAPVFWTGLLAAQERRPRSLATLRFAMTGATAIPPGLVAEVTRVLGVPTRAAWGMTEVGLGIRTREDDPPGWAAHSDGRPLPGLETDLRPEGDPAQGVYRLHVRGPMVCVGVGDSGSGRLLSPHDGDGWLDTGDLVRGDGRGGLRMVGRAADRVGGAFMIPVADVEDTLTGHPAVREVAVVGYGGPGGQDLPCAVVVPDGVPPSLAELRGYLTARGMTDWYQPTRLELLDELPRNTLGKVRKDRLRALVDDRARRG